MLYKKVFSFPLYSSPKLGEVAVSRWGLSVFQFSTLNSQLSVFRFPFSVFRFQFSRPCHGAAILGVTGGGRSALTGGAPVGRLLGCAESF